MNILELQATILKPGGNIEQLQSFYRTGNNQGLLKYPQKLP